MIELEIGHSHLYPGARGRVSSGTGSRGTEAVLRFADGASAAATLDDAVLRVAAYRTDAGTKIAAKSWRLRFAGEAEFTVDARLD